VTFHSRQEVGDWRDVVASQLATPFVMGESALMRAAVVADDDDMTVILCFYHPVSDGISALHVLDDLLASLSGAILPPGEVLPAAEVIAARCFPPAASTAAPAPSPVSEPSPRWHSPDGARSQVATISLNSSDTAGLLQQCRHEQTTIHGALSAAFGTAMAALCGKAKPRIYSPLDLRRELPVGSRICNMMFSSVRAEIDQDLDFWTVARRSVQGIDEARSPRHFMASTAQLESLFAEAPSRETLYGAMCPTLGDCMISNLGAPALFESRPGLQVKALWGPFCCTYLRGYQLMGAATFDGVLRITNTTLDPIPGLLDLTVEKLRRNGLSLA
jgi:hypothetical protein